MSLLFQNIAGTSSAGSKTTAAGGKQAAGTAAASGASALVGTGTFNQSLTQMMTGDGTQQNAATIIGAGTLLEGLMKLVALSTSSSGDEGNGDGQDVANLLQSMLGDTDKLDEAVATDPGLLAALQGWLGQIQNLLNQDTSAGSEALTANGEALAGPLSENPATIRFVVQDGLAQLVSILQKTDGNGNAPLEAMKLLQSFQDILGDAFPVQPKQSASGQANEVSQVSHAKSESSLSGTEVKRLSTLLDFIQQNESTTVSKNIQTTPSLLSKSTVSDAAVSTLFKGEQGTAGGEQAAAVDKQEPVIDIFSTQNTMTAGQLVMRQGINSSVKTAAAPVPVEKFSEEMTGFVVSKLDFVKQQGMSEARITLYPENLGQVDVKLTMQNGQLVAQFTTEHAATKDLLEQQMSQLRSSLQTQGVQVEKLVVTQNQSLQSQMYHDGRQPNSGQQQQSNRRSKEREAPSDDALKIAEIGEELNEWLAGQEEAQGGNSFMAKA
ncbi:flagellar hook-length control protein FliK [Paenibacillus dokdonensis]|uniref:Flagellar hook-length control protein FliK n=1 Tax=Paenibacillus dokdonensis TaxID=2567944 RepID=A0ABU6GLA4_9BACL|nr:flagellar hook-length control protein FliK [Paenibacillus dokdonensis]MEC0240529.1 flagellar hook-length control protein FliK [Paenibacillus dokdonensis]